jgi:phospholipid/cholesterol/gamma-HCH transport system permease protein
MLASGRAATGKGLPSRSFGRRNRRHPIRPGEEGLTTVSENNSGIFVALAPDEPKPSVNVGGQCSPNRHHLTEGQSIITTPALPRPSSARPEAVVPGTADRQHGRLLSPNDSTAFASPRPVGERSALAEIGAWVRRYLRSHPLESLNTVGGQAVLGVRAVQYLSFDLLTGRFKVGEFIEQAAFMAGTAFLPTILVTIPISVTLAIQFSLLAGQVGATSLSGAATGLVVIRQGAPLVAALLLASAVGSALCADLGSRTMREEIDAMEVMGVSPVRRLVVPRLAAVIVVGLGLTGVTSFVGYIASYLYNVYLQNGTPGSFIATFSSFATMGDFWLALVKAIIFGAIVAIVSCHKGLSTHGGPAGVANSVNAAVVESVLLLMIVNVVMSQLYVIVFPRQTI